MDVTSKRF